MTLKALSLRFAMCSCFSGQGGDTHCRISGAAGETVGWRSVGHQPQNRKFLGLTSSTTCSCTPLGRALFVLVLPSRRFPSLSFSPLSRSYIRILHWIRSARVKRRDAFDDRPQTRVDRNYFACQQHRGRLNVNINTADCETREGY